MLAYVSKATINRRLEIWLSSYSRVAFRCGTFILQNRPIQIIFTTVRLLSKERKKKRGGGGEKILSINFVVLEERRKGRSFRTGSAKSESQSANLHPAFPRRPGIQFPKCFNSFKGCTRRRRGGVARIQASRMDTRERIPLSIRCTPVFPWQP